MFDDDNRAESFRDVYLHRPATTIVVLGPGEEELYRLELEELNLTKEQCDPTWLALHEAEEAAPSFSYADPGVIYADSAVAYDAANTEVSK